MKTAKYLPLLLVFLLPLCASAETVVRTGDSISIDTNQVVENDFYGAAGSLSVSGDIREDMYALGGSITQNGMVGADMTAVGGSVQVHAPVADDVRIIGGEVVIANAVGGDVFVFGGMLKILSSASVAGNVYFYGSEAEINGNISGSVMGASDKLRINGAVGGDVDVMTSTLVLGDAAKVTGDVSYDSPNELVRAQNAEVGGQIFRNQQNSEKEGFDTSSFTHLIIWLFASLSLYLLFRSEISQLVKTIEEQPARSVVLGLGVLVLVPVAAVLLLVTVLGSLLGIVGLLAFVCLVIVSAIVMPIVVGSYLMQFYRKDNQVTLVSVFVGALAVWLVSLVPVIGAFAVFIATILTLGGISYSLYRFLR